MKKNILYCLLVLLVLNKNALAQLQNGSIAPDFTVTDINNKSHHLYAYLDSGYSVILDLSAVWCGPCWTYHNSGALEELWANHGPIGETGVNSNTTNDVIVLWVEGDPNTADSLIYGGGNSAGNWTDGVDFPIINDNNLAPTYALTYWPTIYTICPNRTLTLSGTINATAHYNLIQNCVQATQGLNAGILSYQGDTITCGTSVNAKAIVQNLGTEELTAFTIKVFEGTNELASENYSGNPMSTYATTEIEFGNVAISGSTNLEIKITDTDANESDNSVTQQISQANTAYQNLTVKITLDNFGQDISWSIKSEDGELIVNGGPYQNTQNVQSLELQELDDVIVQIDPDGCYIFEVRDAYSDGMYGDQQTFIKVFDANDQLITAV